MKREREREKNQRDFRPVGAETVRLVNAVSRGEDAGNDVADGRYNVDNDDELAGSRLSYVGVPRRDQRCRDGGIDERRRRACSIDT